MRSGPYKPDINMYNMQEIGFAKAFLSRGISTDIMYFSDESREEVLLESNDARIKILWEKGYKIMRTGFYPRMVNKDRLKQYDLVILTEFSQIMTVIVGNLHNNCVLYTGPYYNLFKLPFIEPIYDFLFTKSIDNRMKKIYTKSEMATDYMQKKGYHNLYTLGVGLDTDRFDKEKEMLPVTAELVETMRANRCLLYVGSLTDRKNFPFTLKVFEDLKTKHNSDYKLVVIGKGKKKYVSKCFDAVPKKIVDDIIYVESVSNAQLKYIYPLADFFLLPSKKEIFGMVLLEAMYFECIPVTSLNGGSSTLINNNVNGLVIKDFDSTLWADLIISARNSDKINKMKKNAKARIEDSFLWDKVMVRFFEQLNRKN